jgi:hypothetical protein
MLQQAANVLGTGGNADEQGHDGSSGLDAGDDTNSGRLLEGRRGEAPTLLQKSRSA